MNVLFYLCNYIEIPGDTMDQDFFIRIKMKSGIVNINGFELVMKEMTKDDLIITGNIESVDYEKNVM